MIRRSANLGKKMKENAFVLKEEGCTCGLFVA
jgi:hypothetical protein